MKCMFTSYCVCLLFVHSSTIVLSSPSIERKVTSFRRHEIHVETLNAVLNKIHRQSTLSRNVHWSVTKSLHHRIAKVRGQTTGFVCVQLKLSSSLARLRAIFCIKPTTLSASEHVWVLLMMKARRDKKENLMTDEHNNRSKQSGWDEEGRGARFMRCWGGKFTHSLAYCVNNTTTKRSYFCWQCEWRKISNSASLLHAREKFEFLHCRGKSSSSLSNVKGDGRGLLIGIMCAEIITKTFFSWKYYRPGR